MTISNFSKDKFKVISKLELNSDVFYLYANLAIPCTVKSIDDIVQRVLCVFSEGTILEMTRNNILLYKFLHNNSGAFSNNCSYWIGRDNLFISSDYDDGVDNWV